MILVLVVLVVVVRCFILSDCQTFTPNYTVKIRTKPVLRCEKDKLNLTLSNGKPRKIPILEAALKNI